jgi:voltage-gated potassium channel
MERPVTSIPPFLLLFLLTFAAFLVPFFPEPSCIIIYRMVFTVIVFVSVFVLETGRKQTMAMALIIIAVKWIIVIFRPDWEQTTTILQLIFFLLIVMRLLVQTATFKRPTNLIIIDTINGYFLLALASALLVGFMNYVLPGSFNFHVSVEKPISGLNDYIYYSIVVFTTTGFGDIVPLTPKAKSVSNMISVAGQLYVAIVMAMLIGHYIASRSNGRPSANSD